MSEHVLHSVLPHLPTHHLTRSLVVYFLLSFMLLLLTCVHSACAALHACASLGLLFAFSSLFSLFSLTATELLGLLYMFIVVLRACDLV